MWSPLFAAASEEWDGDERLSLVGCGIICVFGAGFWVKWLACAGGLGREKRQRWLLGLALLVSLGLLAMVSWFWTAKEIRHGQSYTWLVLAMGGAWLSVCSGLFRWLGLSVREDACERRNRAAALALSGALFGATCVFCGANTGEGPSFLNNVYSAWLGGVGWFALWLALESATTVSRSITEERDVATGLRLGAFLAAEGLVLGRALAGNWRSVEATTQDFFRDGWPAVVLLVGAAIFETMLRPTSTRPFPAWPTHGALAALLYLGAAGAWVLRLGWWEGAPR